MVHRKSKSSDLDNKTFCVIRKVQVQQRYYKLIFTLYNMKQTKELSFIQCRKHYSTRTPQHKKQGKKQSILSIYVKKTNKRADWKGGSEVGYKCAVKWYGANILISFLYAGLLHLQKVQDTQVPGHYINNIWPAVKRTPENPPWEALLLLLVTL